MTYTPTLTTASDGGASSNQDAFDIRALPCFTDVKRYAQTLTRNWSDTDDLVQETFTRALRSWHHFQPSANCRHWLFAICRNTHHRRWERERLHERVLERFRASAAHEVGWWSSCGRVADEDAFDAEEHLAHALDTIPSNYRKVFELVDLDDRTYEDAAMVLCIPVGTIRSRLFRARRLLRGALGDHRSDAA